MAKFLKKFLDRAPINLCSPNTKSKNWPKIFQELPKFLEKFLLSINDLLSTYILLIQNYKIGQKFYSFKNFNNSKNLISFPRIMKFLEKFLGFLSIFNVSLMQQIFFNFVSREYNLRDSKILVCAYLFYIYLFSYFF